MPTTMTRRYHFEAAHWLPNVAETHRCHRTHGHNYEIDVTVGGGLKDTGFIIDFWDLDDVIKPLLDLVDHRTLNDVVGLENPTAELIGHWFVAQIGMKLLPLQLDIQLHNVRVYETKDCWADVSPAHS